ncbi:MAG: hypothetical protein V1720_10345 [bacterium]
MKWCRIESDYFTGSFNMAFDLALAENCKSDTAYFRLYRWNPFCISLGANQNFSDINIEKAAADGIDVVKRPTGGRAILHAGEWTYCVVMPIIGGLSARDIYNKISHALVKGLMHYNVRLALADLENAQPNFPELLKKPAGALCFASTAKSEVKFDGRKIIGSAQRVLNKIVLQHGSILCGSFHRKLPDYLNLDEVNKKILTSELQSKTIEIETILQSTVDYDKLEKSLIKGFAEEWQINFDETITTKDDRISFAYTKNIFHTKTD